ncbi:hypothetical protein [Pedobacter alluvionis]|uniref:Uncharacterized protein n=1 Tax=Pedobacter alluvionis TaxID=475253 RepID=A0A497Y502_9SPHI|nr:hypothetical protein [Pedobacter alluvionis]RLJ75148.1 hypothetical protein BCL90_3497 [Pedobacter alluvionis]TFB30251.1 hypothetical protein E3V97_18960 [Pedobacter alluvionis]
MNKIISTTLILIGIISIQSCRQLDEEEIINVQMKTESSKSEYSKGADSTQTTPPAWSPIEPKTDPPPKDRDQWRQRL